MIFFVIFTRIEMYNISINSDYEYLQIIRAFSKAGLFAASNINQLRVGTAGEMKFKSGVIALSIRATRRLSTR